VAAVLAAMEFPLLLMAELVVLAALVVVLMLRLLVRGAQELQGKAIPEEMVGYPLVQQTAVVVVEQVQLETMEAYLHLLLERAGQV